jgi:signal transduction histidine kinase
MWSDRVGRVLAALAIVFYGVDVLFLGGSSAWSLASRVVWATSLLGYPILIRRSAPSWWQPLSDLHGILNSLSILGISFATGGVHSPYFVLVPVLPVVNALMYRQGTRASLVSGSVGCVGTLLLAWQVDERHITALTWASIVLAITLLAAYLGQQMHRVQRVEQEARLDRQRRESLEALASSEHRRAQAEKLATVGRLASGVAHEINNPLAFVGANVNYVRDMLRVPGEVLCREDLIEVLDETREGLQHIRQIVSDLRGISRMGTQEPSYCVLAEVVADAVRLASLRMKSVAKPRVDVPRDLPRVFIVRQRLVQVVLNLLVNAADALEEHNVQNGEVRVLGRLEGSQVVLLVEDNGPGFAPQVLARLFEPFFTTKGPEKGTGLGLTLSRELVEQLGGSLTASNRPEGGARLRLEFPAHHASTSQGPSPQGLRG